ncbi:MAG: HNH endonuclease signature motif containing protein [Pirellulales bacterium]
MNRRPPAAVRRALRREVGYGCPVSGCGRPYLVWHHFDPPWADQHHHNPEGMIALCRDCHDDADAGAYTKDQLREMKKSGGSRKEVVAGEFRWRRNRLLTFVGGQFHYEVRYPLVVRDEGPLIWFNRDEDGCFLLNVRWPRFVDLRGFLMEDNYWLLPQEPQDVVCPPSGRSLSLIYDNNRRFSVKFEEVGDYDVLCRRFVEPNIGRDQFLSLISMPVTIVELSYVISDWQFELTSRGSGFADQLQLMPGGVFMNGEVGIQIDPGFFRPPPGWQPPTNFRLLRWELGDSVSSLYSEIANDGAE